MHCLVQASRNQMMMKAEDFVKMLRNFASALLRPSTYALW